MCLRSYMAATAPRSSNGENRIVVQYQVHKEAIISLYASHDLAFVVQELRDKFDFDATPKQYKRRFAKWGVVKNLRYHRVRNPLEKPLAARSIKNISARTIQRHRNRLNTFQGERHQFSSLSQGVMSSTPLPKVQSSQSQESDQPQSTTPKSLGEVNNTVLYARRTAAVHALLLHKILQLPPLENVNISRFSGISCYAEKKDKGPEDYSDLLVQKIAAAWPICPENIHETLDGLEYRPHHVDLVYEAAFYLYRRRQMFLHTRKGSTSIENIAAAVHLASGLHGIDAQHLTLYQDWYRHSPLISSLATRACQAQLIITAESVVQGVLDATSWQRWSALMGRACEELNAHFEEPQNWHIWKISSMIDYESAPTDATQTDNSRGSMEEEPAFPNPKAMITGAVLVRCQSG